MFVWGCPTKLALLKMTQGCCGPATNRFQKIWYAAGADCFVAMAGVLVRPSKTALRTSEQASITESTITAMAHPRIATGWALGRSTGMGVPLRSTGEGRAIVVRTWKVKP